MTLINMKPAQHNPVLCACDYDYEYEEFEFSQELHQFIPHCTECGAAMAMHHSGIWECSEAPVSHVRVMYSPEDFPPFFGDDPEDEA